MSDTDGGGKPPPPGRRVTESARRRAEEEEAAFSPRLSLARSPPRRPISPGLLGDDPFGLSGATTSTEGSTGTAEKRQRDSPPDAPSVKNVEKRSKTRTAQVPPIGGILTSDAPSRPVTPPPPPPTIVVAAEDDSDGSTSIGKAPKEALLNMTKEALDGIARIASGGASRLNKADLAVITGCSLQIMAVVAALDLRLAEAEAATCRAELRCAEAKLAAGTCQPTGNSGAAVAPSYASMLRLPGGQSRGVPEKQGPMLAIYPKEADTFKTAEETKAELKRAVRPAEIGVGVARLRRVGNAGVLLETTSSEAAERITKAVPPSLRVAEPKKRYPLVALRNCEGDPNLDAVLGAMHEQNFGDSSEWPLERLKKSCRLAFKKSKRGDDRTTVVLECEPSLRDTLITRGRIFLGWDSVRVEDFITVTCCSRCQQYGHPERHCRAEEVTCGKCGDKGHRADTCASKVVCCATCKKFGKKHSGHATASKTCPARLHAEERWVATTKYGF